jgi:uncharacterized cupredoxin-like copper-binding protein
VPIAGPSRASVRAAILAASVLATVQLAAGCDAGAPPATPPIRAGSAGAPREVNVVMKDWVFLPDPVDLVPGETVILHVINGGLDVHELVIGSAAVQDAWEAAEAAHADPPPGPTPAVSLDPAVAGTRLVVASGQRIDLAWTVPGAAELRGLSFGCHIPGHWAKGMRASIRVAVPGG